MAPADVGLGVFQLLLLGLLLAQFELVEAGGRSICQASSRLRCCERSFWHCTTMMPVGTWVRRTAGSRSC